MHTPLQSRYLILLAIETVLVLGTACSVIAPAPTPLPVFPSATIPPTAAPRATLPPAPPGTPTLAPNPATPVPPTRAAIPSATLPAAGNLPVGQWTIFNTAFAPISAMDKKQADTWLNKIANITSGSITFDGKTCQITGFTRTSNSASDYFLGDFKTDPAKIGVGQDKFEVIQTSCVSTPFERFVQLNPTTLIIAWDGVFFFLSPAGQPGSGFVPTPTPKRISFAPGATSATIQGALTMNGLDQYVLRVLAGQTVSLNAVPANGNVLLVVYGVDGTVLQSDHVGMPNFTGQVPLTQDYIVHVRAWGDTAPTYTLQVTIPPVPTPDSRPQPKRISFAAGSTTATMQGALAPNSIDPYVLRALAGQTMTVNFAPSAENLTMQISGADGSVFVSGGAKATMWSGVLPSTQDYFITVLSNAAVPATYSLQVTIPPQ